MRRSRDEGDETADEGDVKQVASQEENVTSKKSRVVKPKSSFDRKVALNKDLINQLRNEVLQMNRQNKELKERDEELRRRMAELDQTIQSTTEEKKLLQGQLEQLNKQVREASAEKNQIEDLRQQLRDLTVKNTRQWNEINATLSEEAISLEDIIMSLKEKPDDDKDVKSIYIKEIIRLVQGSESDVDLIELSKQLETYRLESLKQIFDKYNASDTPINDLITTMKQ